MKHKTTLELVADTLHQAWDLQDRPRGEIREALKLLVKSNPQLVMYVLYELAAIYEEEA
jgi:hypothetical protein